MEQNGWLLLSHEEHSKAGDAVYEDEFDRDFSYAGAHADGGRDRGRGELWAQLVSPTGDVHLQRVNEEDGPLTEVRSVCSVRSVRSLCSVCSVQ